MNNQISNEHYFRMFPIPFTVKHYPLLKNIKTVNVHIDKDCLK